MTRYTEKRGITTKTEYTEFDAIGWSCDHCNECHFKKQPETKPQPPILAANGEPIQCDGDLIYFSR